MVTNHRWYTFVEIEKWALFYFNRILTKIKNVVVVDRYFVFVDDEDDALVFVFLGSELLIVKHRIILNTQTPQGSEPECQYKPFSLSESPSTHKF